MDYPVPTSILIPDTSLELLQSQDTILALSQRIGIHRAREYEYSRPPGGTTEFRGTQGIYLPFPYP